MGRVQEPNESKIKRTLGILHETNPQAHDAFHPELSRWEHFDRLSPEKLARRAARIHEINHTLQNPLTLERVKSQLWYSDRQFEKGINGILEKEKKRREMQDNQEKMREATLDPLPENLHELRGHQLRKIEDLLVQHGQNGNKAAVEALLELAKNHIKSVISATRLTGAEADDVTQETHVNIWQKLHQYQGSGQFTTWAWKVAFNEAVNHIRTKTRRNESALHEIPSTTQDPAQTKNLGEMHAAIRQLSDNHQRILRERYFSRSDGKQTPYEEVAEKLGISMGTVKSRLHRAHESLQYLLGQQHDPDE